jgi:DMSO/TMAO reductase YedYZ molybdopterin-dependent catalytic subunit
VRLCAGVGVEPAQQVEAAPRARRFAALRARLAPISPWGPPLLPAEFTKPRRRLVAVAGTLAATVALLAVLILRFQGAGMFVPEVAVEWVVDHIPGSLEAGAIGLMGGFAKVIGLSLAIAGFLAVHAFFALYYPRVHALSGARWKTIVFFAAAPTAGTLFVALPVFGQGIAGVNSYQGVGAATVGALASSIVFAAVLDLSYREFSRTSPQGVDITRRTAIQAAAILLLAGALGGAILNGFVTRVGRLSFTSLSALRDNEVTPSGEFYVVSKNLSPPTVNPSTWALAVDGLVDRPLSLSSNELLARPQTEEYVTLECVSNEVGGNLISNGRWQGIPLRGLLAEAGVQSGATWVQFTCADDYVVGVPLMRAQAPGSMLALQLNGERVTREHGFPARILVPGLYGMMHAKWLTKITLVDHEVRGFWQLKGWTNDGRIKTTAIIAVAPPTARLGGAETIAGVAFAGERQVSRVEISVDGGGSWAGATLRAPLSPYAWTLWSYDWTPAAEGRAKVFVRAYERSGATEAVQPSAPASPFPEGSSGYDTLDITVTA